MEAVRCERNGSEKSDTEFARCWRRPCHFGAWGDNLWPVVKENGAAWALRAAGLQAATSQEVPQAEASPAPQKEAVKETEPEATSLPTATPVPVQEKTDTELPVLPAPTPDPERETAAVAATFMGGGEEINGFFVKDTSDSGA